MIPPNVTTVLSQELARPHLDALAVEPTKLTEEQAKYLGVD